MRLGVATPVVVQVPGVATSWEAHAGIDELTNVVMTADGLTVLPHAAQARVPIWIGGNSAASLRRAVDLADGWMPFGLTSEQIPAMLGAFDIPTGFEVVLSAAVDPEADPRRTRTLLAMSRDAGATAITCAVRAESAQHYCEQLTRLRDIARLL